MNDAFDNARTDKEMLKKFSAKLTENEKDFLAGYLMVSNMGGNPEVSEKGMRIAGGRWCPLRTRFGGLVCGETWLHDWLEHALDGQVDEAEFEKNMRTEMRHFEKELKKGIPACWPDCVTAINFWRKA